MKIAILSDVHDHLERLTRVLDKAKEAGAEALIFCGDFCAPFTLAHIAEHFPHPIHVVFGNNDGDPLLLARIAAQHAHVTLHGPFAYLDLDGRRIAVNHYPPIARDQALSGQYDLVCYGHNHEAHIEQVGSTLLVNPGEVMGRLGRSTFALYDTAEHQATIYEP